jgi:tetratricopeptide (TPR) repeat protein
VNLGIALADQYDLAGGLAQFSEAIRLDPRSAKAHYNLGRFYFYIGKYDEARKELETACQIQADYPDALYSLALTERQLNNALRATELLEKVVVLSPGNADAQYLLGQNLDQMGKTDEAIAHWKAAVRVDPNQSQSLYHLARTLDKRHDPEAQQYMERFRALEKSQRLFDRVQALGNFAIEAAKAQNWPQAVEQMKEAIQLCGQCAESAHLHRNLGLIYCRTGNRQDGEKELRAALQLDPHDEDAKKALAQLANLPHAPQN